MALEFAAEAYEKEIWEIDEPADGESDPNEEKKEPEDRLIMKTGSLIKYLTEKKTEGIQAEKLAYIFHQKLADLITDGCRKIRKKTKCNCVALSGGVFQNRLLLRMVEEGLEKEHFTVLRHHLIPANDGGIALGQAAYAMQYIQEENNMCVGLSAKVVRISDGTAVVDAGAKDRSLQNYWKIWNREIM